VLATGDSMMQGIDGFLADELGGTATVRSDVRLGSSLSRPAPEPEPGTGPSASEWEPIARDQEARLRPSAVVVSIGAGEGFTMTTPTGAKEICCGEPWAAEYARRTQVVMGSYARARSRGRLLWLTIALPRDARRRAITTVVNSQIVATAATLPGVRVVRMDELFTPDGYRDVMRYRGRDVDVRDSDGVHLNVAGTAIAAKLVAEELKRATRTDR